MPNSPVDLMVGPRYALKGKIVTMNSAFQVLERGVVYIDAGQITAVLPAKAAPPPGFEAVPLINTRGTLYPGLIELHNHLSYNILPLWQVPKRFTNRAQWGIVPAYRKLISGPMQVLGKTAGYVEAIVRYVECKCLLAGVTTSQGIALYSNNSIQKFYRGLIRNVEETGEAALPDADTKISDVEASDAEKFLDRLQSSSCLLLHLSEGIDAKAHEHFEALQLANGAWALAASLSGIHCAALKSADFQAMRAHNASMVWSPLSNLLLYGQTADLQAAKDSGIQIAIGSDWSPSGSKNLLGELKVARLYSQAAGGIFSDRDLVGMATINPARMLKWQDSLGSLEAGKRADILVVDGTAGDPYARLLQAGEQDIILVVINGMPRYGRPSLMEPPGLPFGRASETWRVRSARRLLNLVHPSADPVVGSLTLRQASQRLSQGLHDLAQLARDGLLLHAETPPAWTLVLDHEELDGASQRTHLFLNRTGRATGLVAAPTTAEPLSDILEPVKLDPLTVVDDPQFFDLLQRQPNLPDYIKQGLPGLY